MVITVECRSNVISAIVKPSFRLRCTYFIRCARLEVSYSVCISGVNTVTADIYSLDGNFLMINLVIASESPFIK